MPGEWFYDADAGALYVYPNGTDLSTAGAFESYMGTVLYDVRTPAPAPRGLLLFL